MGNDARPALRPRRAGRLAMVAGCCAAAVAVVLLANGQHAAADHITLSAGAPGTTRALVGQALATEITARGVECRLIEAGSARVEFAKVTRGAIDFAMIPGIWPIPRESGVRVVAPMHVEAMHLLVKREIADSVGENLAGLRGRIVDLGPKDSGSAALAEDALRFAGVQVGGPGGGAGATVLNLEIADLEARIEGDRAALPDAIFHLSTVPSLVAWRLVREADYRLVALPFAEAFRLAAVLAPDAETDAEGIDRRLVTEARIPAYLYRTDPPVPALDLPTIGARLVLVASETQSDETVAEVLHAVLHTHVARMLHPPVDRASIAAAPRHNMHPGTRAFLARYEPAITAETVGDLNNTLGIVGAVVGASVFLVQGVKQRSRARLEALVATLLQRAASLERRIVEVELGATLDLRTLMDVQRELLQLKSEALDRFTSGELGDHSVLGSLLAPIDAAVEHAGDLLLHARSALEDQPMGAARTAWTEAAARSLESHPASPGPSGEDQGAK